MTKPSNPVQAAFEAFWSAYPKRPDNPRAAARQMFERRVREGADPAMIVAAAGRYAADVRSRGLDPLFVPHARTWLSQRRYEDYPAATAHTERAPSHHPLAWLAREIGDAAWSSWIAPLRILRGEDGTVILARHQFGLDHVRRHWGQRIETYIGRVAWGLQHKAANQ